MWPFTRKQKEETRSSGAGYTAELLAARQAYITGSQGVAELTATAQSCVTLWENGFTIADVDGLDLLTPSILGIAGRSLALRGEAVFLIEETGLVPASDWDLSTRNSRPNAYRLSIPEVGGGKTRTALAGEVLHFRIGSDCTSPFFGTSPLKRSQLSAGLLNAVEAGLGEVFENSPLGTQVLPMPETPETDFEKLGAQFKGKRGRVLLRESVNVSAAGGPAPNSDWKSNDLSPDLQKSMSVEILKESRNAICGVFGVLPSLFQSNAQGPLVREAQRHLAQWGLQPIAVMMAHECSDKIGGSVTIDCMRPLQAFDAGGRARALQTVVQALAMAKETGIDSKDALNLVDWESAKT